MISVGAKPGPSCVLTHPGSMLLIFSGTAVLHMENIGKAALNMHPNKASGCTVHSLVSTEAKVPSGQTGVDLADISGPVESGLGWFPSHSPISPKIKASALQAQI